MHALNSWMNRIDSMIHSVDQQGNPPSLFKKSVLSRFGTVLVGAPLEVAAVAQNIILAPVYAVGAVAKLAVKTVRCVSSAEFLRKMDQSLPSITDFIKTVLRIAAYAIGAISTAVVGFISPDFNFKAHCAVPYLNLATNNRRLLEDAAAEAERQKQAQKELNKALEEEKRELLDAVQALLKAEEEKKVEEQARPATPVLEPAVLEEEIVEETKASVVAVSEEVSEEKSLGASLEDINSSEFELFDEIDQKIAEQNAKPGFWSILGWGNKVEEPVVQEQEVLEKV